MYKLIALHCCYMNSSSINSFNCEESLRAVECYSIGLRGAEMIGNDTDRTQFNDILFYITGCYYLHTRLIAISIGRIIQSSYFSPFFLTKTMVMTMLL